MGRKGMGGERGEGRGRGKASRGCSGAGPQRLNASFIGSLDNGYSRRQPGIGSVKQYFSLSEEARNTERNRSWNSDLKLRHSRIAFISAGTSKAEELTQVPLENHSKDERCPKEESNEETVKHPEGSLTEPDVEAEVPISNMTLTDAHTEDFQMGNGGSTRMEGFFEKGWVERVSKDAFFTDVKGSDRSILTGLPPPEVRRSPSPTVSISSDEVILFAGRNASLRTSGNGSTLERSANLPDSISQGSAKSTEVLHRSVATVADESLGSGASHGLSVTAPTLHKNPVAIVLQGLKDVPRATLTKSKKASAEHVRNSRSNRSRKSIKKANVEAMDDYIANTCDTEGHESFSENPSLNRRDLGNSSGDQWVDDEEISAAELQEEILERTVEEWDSAGLHDFDKLSTSSEELENAVRILAKREKPSGAQYLVVGGGFTIDDARWLPAHLLKTPSANEKVGRFEEEQAEVQRLFGSDDDTDDSLTLDQQLALDLREDLDDLEDEQDLEERRKARMTDEQIARLLSKQEELGLGSRDLMLFDGDDIAGTEIEEAQLDGSFGKPSTMRSQTKSKRKDHHQNRANSATATADVFGQDPYGGFDVMDQERPSLRKRAKGRRGELALELSDSELETTITQVWENDRNKKKLRKQEREELRAQGLLGKKGNVDMKAKYAEGMSMDQVKVEIRNFLVSSIESLPLPPLAKKERKLIHEIANLFKLKSKSIGSGKSRYPVLFKTARSVHYDEGGLNAVDAILSSNRFLPRMDKAKKRGLPVGKGRGGFAGAGISYRDGEVVGAAAPELGQENRGRAMLEKMGWSTGKTLGALNNTRGIIQPVAQIVKTGKAGLG